MTERYKPKGLISGAPATVRNFTPEKGGRDRFGNRLFLSKELAYRDGTGETTKAGILISGIGQEFIRANTGILKDIAHGLAKLETNGETRSGEIVDLGNGRTLESKETGGQSNFYILTVGPEKYAVKTQAARSETTGAAQPYLNEMLQTQSLGLDLKDELFELRVEFSKFLFASGQVSVTRYEEDEKNYESLNIDRLTDIKTTVLGYILEKRVDQDPLWDNINVDLPLGTLKGVVTALHNFRTRADGTLVWIDPFLYERPK